MGQRIFIIGNAGSGKTWLAGELVRKLRAPVVHLDELHWLPNFAGERPRPERDRLVDAAAAGDSWIMEGIFGSILRQVLPRVTTLVWLDLSEEECVANLMQRGQTDGGTDAQFQELLDYARGYRLRRDHPNSFDGHWQLFDAFAVERARLLSRADAAQYLRTFGSA